MSISARDRIHDAIAKGAVAAGLTACGEIHLERPNDPEHGDISCNIAMTAAKAEGKNPRALAQAIVDGLDLESDFVDRVEVAGPGFINFTFASKYLTGQVEEINRLGGSYGDSKTGGGRKVQIEYVSANPTGPLVIVSARAAAVGTALVNVLRKIGHEVESEYYINDAGAQIEKLGRSLLVRFRQRLGEDIPFPDEGYPGNYLVDIAAGIPLDDGKGWLDLPDVEAIGRFGGFAIDRILELIKMDFEAFGIRYDVFFRESQVHREGGEIEQALDIMKSSEHVFEEEGAVWFRSTAFGDEKDRVLVRSDGTPTYFLADIAYHLNKLRRGFDRVIDIWGADHHGYIARMKGGTRVVGAAADWLEVVLVQWVRLVEDGKQVSMSKRGGEFVTLRELIDDVGADAAKFFFLMRKTNAHLDFNLTLARKESDENPVYYVQYAHARISSVVEYARSEGVEFPEDLSCVETLKEPEEIDLMRKLVIFPQVIEGIAEMREPHRLTAYVQQLAASFHHFYHICRIVSSDARLSGARLLLAEATRIVLAESLRILGIGAPERM